jgi:hypothetical protein
VDARAWIQAILATARDEPDHLDPPPECGEPGPPESVGEWQPLGKLERQILGGTDIALFIRAGPAVLPDLIEHVGDHRWTPQCFHYPLSSGMDLTGMKVGELACYMFEAILRENPYFTRSGRFLYVPPTDMSKTGRDQYALDQAATAYQRWYDRCFEEESGTVICPADDLPSVKWDYDSAAWPTLLRIEPEWTREIFADLAAKYPARAAR